MWFFIMFLLATVTSTFMTQRDGFLFFAYLFIVFWSSSMRVTSKDGEDDDV